MKFEELYLSLVQAKPDLSPEAVNALAREHYAYYKRFEKEVLTSSEYGQAVIEVNAIQQSTQALSGGKALINVNPTLVEKYKVDFKSSIGHDKVICCFCGHSGSILTESHLKNQHGFTRNEYLLYFDQPPGTVLTCQKVRDSRSGAIKKAKNKTGTPTDNKPVPTDQVQGASPSPTENTPATTDTKASTSDLQGGTTQPLKPQTTNTTN